MMLLAMLAPLAVLVVAEDGSSGAASDGSERGVGPALTPWDGECFFKDRKFNLPDYVLETVEGKNNIHKCQKACDDNWKCVWVQYEHSTKTCELLRFPVPESLAGSIAMPGWEGATYICDVPARGFLFFEDVPSPVFAVAAAGAVVAAAGVWALSTRSGKEAAREYEPLSPA